MTNIDATRNHYEQELKESIVEKIKASINFAYNELKKSNPDAKFTREFYRKLYWDLSGSIVSATYIEQVYGTWKHAVNEALNIESDTSEQLKTAISELTAIMEPTPVKDVILEKNEVEDTGPLVVRKSVPDGYKVFIIPDIHIPYEDKAAVTATIKCAEAFQPNEIIQLGDLLDCYGLSKYMRSTYKTSDLAAELKQANNLLKLFKERSGAKIATFLEGNHEARIRKYILNKAPDLAGLDATRVDNLLQLQKIGWDFIAEHKFYAINDLYFTHGEYANAHSPLKHINEYNVSVVHGHTHHISCKYQRGLDKTIQGWELGCLCSMDVGAEYVKKANWQHGFGTATFNKGRWWIQAYHIQDGLVMFQDVLLRG